MNPRTFIIEYVSFESRISVAVVDIDSAPTYPITSAISILYYLYPLYLSEISDIILTNAHALQSLLLICLHLYLQTHFMKKII